MPFITTERDDPIGYLSRLANEYREKELLKKRADELLRANRLAQVEYPTGKNFSPLKLVSKGLTQFLRDDQDLNKRMGTAGLREGAMMAMMLPAMAIPASMGTGALSKAVAGGALNLGASLPFYALDPESAEPLMDTAIGVGAGLGGIPGAALGALLGWTSDLGSGQDIPEDAKAMKYAGGGAVKKVKDLLARAYQGGFRGTDQMTQYVRELLGETVTPTSMGSNRAVFELGPDKVAKLAIHPQGLVANQNPILEGSELVSPELLVAPRLSPLKTWTQFSGKRPPRSHKEDLNMAINYGVDPDGTLQLLDEGGDLEPFWPLIHTNVLKEGYAGSPQAQLWDFTVNKRMKEDPFLLYDTERGFRNKELTSPQSQMAEEFNRLIKGRQKYAGGGLIKRAAKILKETAPGKSKVADIIREHGGQWLGKGALPVTEISGGRPVPNLDGTNLDENLAGMSVPYDETSPNREELEAGNQWVNKKLRRYIRTQMATPDDPIRKLADQGILHVPHENLNFNPETYGRYLLEGQRLMARSPEAKVWEGASDSSLFSTPTRNLSRIDLEKNPWAKELPSTEPVHGLLGDLTPSDLGFDHLVDELRNAMDPDSGLPSQLRMI